MKRSIVLLLLCIGLIVIAAIGPAEWFLWNRTPPHWADDTVKELEQMGVPMPWKKAQWDEGVTRGDFLLFTTTAFSLTPGEDEQIFSDVPPEHPAYTAINGALHSGWISEGDTFRPDDTLTREELLRICAKLIPLEVDETLQNAATDVEGELQALVSAAVQSELIYLYEGGEFRPEDGVTKAEAAVVLCRILTAQKNGDAVRRAMLLDYLHRFAKGEDVTELCTGGEAERQTFRTETVLPFMKEQKERKTINDLVLTLTPQGANATFILSYPTKKVKHQITWTTEKIGETWKVANSTNRLVYEKPVQLVWEYASRPDMEYSNKNKANIVSPTWFKLLDEKETEVMPKDVPLADGLYLSDYYSSGFAKEAKKRGQQIWALCSNGFTPEMTRTVLSDDSKRQKLIQTLFSKVMEYGLEGVNLDFENMYEEDKDLFTRFTWECSLYAKECGVFLSTDVTKIEPSSHFYSMCYDRAALSQFVDYMMLMAYDQHPRGSEVAGPIAALDWTQGSIEGMLEQVPADILVLGVPFYTRIWQTQEGKVVDNVAATMQEVQDLIKEKELKPLWSDTEKLHYVEYTEEECLYKIWVENKDSMSARIELINNHQLAGIAAWSGGYETPQIWELIEEGVKQ